MLSTGIFLKIKFSKFLQNHFTSPIPIRMKKKIALPSLVCHGLPENAFQVNQLYNVTWSTAQRPTWMPSTIYTQHSIFRSPD